MSVIRHERHSRTDIHSGGGDKPAKVTGTNNRANSTLDQYYSTRGAFNGTDIAVTRLASVSGDGSLQRSISYASALLIYQHFTGELCWVQFVDPDIYYSAADNVIADDARNNTPIDVTDGPSSVNRIAIALHMFCRSERMLNVCHLSLLTRMQMSTPKTSSRNATSSLIGQRGSMVT